MKRPSILIKSLLPALVLGLAACASETAAPPDVPEVAERPTYVIGPQDALNIFVWRNPDLSTTVPVRPDGRISIPLVKELEVAGKTPAEVAADIEEELSQFVQAPSVTVIVTSFAGPYDQQVRIVGEATEPKALAYRDRMTLLDAMISVGGLTEFAAGNRAVLVREDDAGNTQNYTVRLDDLLEEGDISANARLLPGDIIIVPQAWF
ncbi:XrtA/PEP-CTERM system exopolysaccharide export protein [Caenispirillum salinarum]|uniref:XrtA/PEP-CTERM system exopolysaccharide export protein n=1 Tax=Caenispirillum salinarum TaxID=859058 RepID=UPI00384B19EF